MCIRDRTNPYNDQLIATADVADSNAVETALQTAHSLFIDRSKWLSVPQRLAILEKSLELMQQQSDELAKGAAEEGGKPLIDSKVEMVRCIDSIRHVWTPCVIKRRILFRWVLILLHSIA